MRVNTARSYYYVAALALLSALLALLGCGVLGTGGRRTGGAAICYLLGVLLFSGSLYALVWTDTKWLGAVTPLGGVLFLVGWLLLAVRATAPAART